MVLWPKKDGEMTEFLRWLTLTHSQRLHAHRQNPATGTFIKRRFKSFPVEQDQAALNVIRYVDEPSSFRGRKTGAGAVYGKSSWGSRIAAERLALR